MKRRNKLLLGGISMGMFAGAAAIAGAVTAVRRGVRRLSDLRGDDLGGRTVVITGGSRGLGLAMAEEFARHGANIMLCARDEGELMRARQQVEMLGGAEVGAVTCDVSKPQQVQHMIEAARRQFGRIDILVNNAGIISVGPLSTQRLEDFQEAMDVMFWGTVHPTLAVLPEMLERRQGSIVNITSIGGKVSVPHLLPYNCAKFATVGFSEGLHAELKKYGINVLTVVPGLMRTGSHVNAYFKGRHEQEFGWFAVSGTSPLFSVSARHAARRIVNATRRRQAEIIISPQAQLLARVHGMMPGLVTEALALVNRLLPEADGGMHRKLGKESHSAVTRSPLTALGRRAARRYNQAEEIA
jgi:short-subunit dehydrogenase